MIKLLTKWTLEHAGWQCVPWALADSHIWVLNSVGVFAVLLLLKCDNSQQFFVLQRPKLTPCNICRLFCGQCLTVTSTVKQTGWGENFITTKFLFVHLLWALKLICQTDGFLLCLYRKCPTIKKKKEFLWDEAVMVFVLHPQRCKGDSWVQRAVVCSAACWPCLA